MKKRLLSVLLCLCMVMTLIPTVAMASGEESVDYVDYQIMSRSVNEAAEVLEGVAEVSEVGEDIVIKLTSDINGRLHLGGDFMGTWHGNFVLDLNGKKIETDNSFGEAICLDNNFRGQLTITGSGIIKGGENQIIFTSFAGAYFALSEGYDYYTVEINGEDAFDGENTETKSASVAYVTTGEIVITQANQEEGGGNEGGNEGGANTPAPVYTDHIILSHDATHVEDILGDWATITEDGDNIIITLTENLYGRLHFGNNDQDDWEGDFILDLNGFTIEENNTYGEALCLDHDFEGTVTLTGNGTLKGGRNQIVYIGSADLYFAVADGYDYFTAKSDGENIFEYEKNYETEERDTRVYGDELVITQGIGLPVIYTVTFNANGYGTAPESVSVVEGRKIPTPTAPTFDGYIFKGWYKEETCENAWSFYNDTVTEDTTLYARWVEASTPPDDYTSDANRIMAYRKRQSSFDIKGFFGGEWKDTSWGNAYYTYLKVENETESVNVVPLTEMGYDVLDMNVAMDFSFENNGRTLQLVYTVTNNSAEEKTFSLGTGADIQIGSDDSAQITEFEDGSGFMMVSGYDGDKNSQGEYAQFNFFGKNIEGVTDVTSFWYGPYSSSYSTNGHYWSSRSEEAVFFDNEFSESGDFDSAATWHWTDTLDAGVSKTYSILIGIGGEGSENLDAKIITFDANGGTVTPADALTERDGTLATLPTPTRSGYTFNGWFTAANGGDEVTTSTVFEADATIYAQWTRRGGTNLPSGTPPTKDPKPEADNDKPSTPTTPVTPVTPVTPTFFKDVTSADWFYGDIQYVFENGLMNGISADTFSPNAKLTRAMLVTVLYRMEGEPATNRSIPFADLDMGAYYASAVIWAQQNGIVKGVSETMFAPDKNITREQLAAIMHRYAQYKGYDVSVGENTNILSYADVASVSEYAIGSMQYACGSGLINGKSASTLAPQDNATRAEAAAILHRFDTANK